MRIIGPLSITLGAVLLAACAPSDQQGTSSTPATGAAGTTGAGETYLADRSDPCYAERQALDAEGGRVESPVQGLLDAGFAIGGVLDSIRQTGRVGGTIGADGITVAGGYIEALRQENGTILDLVRDATRDIEEENSRIDALVAAFDTLGACRKAGAEAIRADYQAGRVTREDAAAGMVVLRGAYREDIARVRALIEQVSENTETYAQVYNEIAEDNNADAIELGPYRPEVHKSGRASARIVKKRPARQKRATPKGSLRSLTPAPEVRPEVQRMQNALLTNVRKRDTIIARVETAEAETGDLDLALLWQPGEVRKLPT